MTTAPFLPSSDAYDANARAYLGSLLSGQKPDIKPDCGRWAQVVQQLEKVFAEQKTPEIAGAKVKRSLNALCKLQQHKHSGLKELVNPLLTPRTETPTPLSLVESFKDVLAMPVLPDYAVFSSEASQGACPVLDWYEEYSQLASDRAYPGYHAFCGLWMFSVIAGRRVSLQLNAKEFNTNLMLGIVGETSCWAKSFTANIARRMLYTSGLDYRLGPDKVTSQKLLSDMSGKWIPTDYDDLPQERQDEILHTLAVPGQKGLLFDEMGKFIAGAARKNSSSSEFIDLLLTLNDCLPVYKGSTIVRGLEPIDKPYITMLGCMTPSNLSELASAGAEFWKDGFWARFSFIVAPPPVKDKEDPGPPVFKRNPAAAEAPQHLLYALEEWNERLGVPEATLEPKTDKKGEPTGAYTVVRPPLPHTECTITDEAAQAWTTYEHALDILKTKNGHKDFYGSYARLPETAMRIAVLLASISNNNVIELCHWARAQELTELLRGYLHDLYSQVNTEDAEFEKPNYARKLEDKILDYVVKVEKETDLQKIATSRNIARYPGKNVDTGLLRKTLINMVQNDQLMVVQVGKAKIYRKFEQGEDG